MIRRERPIAAIACVLAALMLAIQAAAGFGVAPAHAGPALDRFGNPLCITSGLHAADEAPFGGERHLPSCCGAMCPMGIGPALPPGEALVITPARRETVLRRDWKAAPRGERVSRGALARAPPARV